jgi:hypothetical protein
MAAAANAPAIPIDTAVAVSIPRGPAPKLIASLYRKSRPYAYSRRAFVRRTTRVLIAAIKNGPVQRPSSAQVLAAL